MKHRPVPLFHLFPRRPNRKSSYSSRPVTPLRPFNFPFLCSIYWELALIYVKPGYADPNEFVPILLHSTTHFTLLLVHRSGSNTSPTSSIARQHFVQFRFGSSAETLRIPYTSGTPFWVIHIEWISFDINSPGKLQVVF